MVAAFAGVWVGFALLGDSWFQLLLAGALGIVVTQFGFLGHDASHRQMQLLIGELNHRVRNTLATVQAIASQTLRRAKSPADLARLAMAA